MYLDFLLQIINETLWRGVNVWQVIGYSGDERKD